MTARTAELTVTGFANGGAGVAHDADGRVVFVAGALPGERVLAQIDEQRSSYARAHTTTVLEASPERIAPLCPAAAAGAGCCDLSYTGADYAAHLRAGALADVLDRIGRLGGAAPPPPAVAALGPEPTGWRVRTRLAVGGDGTAGLRARGSSRIVTEPCAGPVTGLLDGVGGLGAVAGSDLVLAVGSDGLRHVAELAPVPGGGGRGRSAAQRARSRRSRPRPVRLIEGEPLVTQRLGAHTWHVPVTGFWQAHRAAPGAYADTVRDFAGRAEGLRAGMRVWDLYGGAGILGAGLVEGDQQVPAVGAVDLVETDPDALAAAESALAADPVHLHRGDVAAVIADLPAPDLVIADPPRRGAGSEVIAAIAAARPRAVVHVGCDAGAFARDLRDYATRGFRVTDWRAFDAFPLTHHVEAIALLESP